MEQVHRPDGTNVLITGASTTGFIGSRSSLEAEGQIRILTNNEVLTLQGNMFIVVMFLYIFYFYRFYGSTFGMNSSKSTALCQAKSHVMKLNPRNQNVRSEGHCDGTPPQPSAVVHVYPC